MNIKLVEQEYTPTNGKIAVVILAFSGDNLCLKQCIRGIEEQQKKGYNLQIFILDDANSPLPQEEYKNYNYRKTYFSRNNNLNGTECSLGMLMEMVRISRQSNAEYIMKVDSDMYIRSLDRFLEPLKTNKNTVVGFRLNKLMNYVAGVTYILPSQGLYNTVRNFSNWYKNEQENSKQFIAHCPQDWAITRCTADTNNYVLWQWENAVNPNSWLLVPFSYKEVNEDGTIHPLSIIRYTMYDFINFGNRHELYYNWKCKKVDVTEARYIAGYYMQNFIQFDLNNHYDPHSTPLQYEKM